LLRESERAMKGNGLAGGVTLVGYVNPLEWDNEGNVIGVGIECDDGPCLVEVDRLGQELFDFLDERVKVTGNIRTDKKGLRRIRVSGYELAHEIDTGDLG